MPQTNKARKSLVDKGMTHQPPAPYNVPSVLHGTRFLVNGQARVLDWAFKR